MTPQQPFTTAGVAAKLADLYALSNNDLLAEANAVRTNMKAWLNTNFILNASQQTWLTGVDDQFFLLAAPQTAFALQNRLNIQLIAPSPLPPPSFSKMVRVSNTLDASYSQSLGFAGSGSLTFELTY